ncbi:shikimate kinase [Methanoregula sp.]|uniref:shikimate kinase n=1 Tax=Methanoregula sp. TaxID=2052170 RepID=UPI0035666239
MKNIIIIGMPGAGKSTLGVILAKTLGWKFSDTDLVLQERTGRLLQEVIDTDGTDAFKKIEEQIVLSLHCDNTVIATGGSVVFSERAMEHLKSEGIVLYLRISCDEMIRRLGNITTRGIVLPDGESLPEMYNERIPLYERYADITIDCSSDPFEKVISRVLDKLPKISK